MSASTIWRAANDQDLIRRVLAMAHRELNASEDLHNTEFGRMLLAGATSVAPLMFPVAIDTEAAYETAVNSGRGAPGYDQDVIPDAALSSAVVVHWPPDQGLVPPLVRATP